MVKRGAHNPKTVIALSRFESWVRYNIILVLDEGIEDTERLCSRLASISVLVCLEGQVRNVCQHCGTEGDSLSVQIGFLVIMVNTIASQAINGGSIPLESTK